EYCPSAFDAFNERLDKPLPVVESVEGMVSLKEFWVVVEEYAEKAYVKQANKPTKRSKQAQKVAAKAVNNVTSLLDQFARQAGVLMTEEKKDEQPEISSLWMREDDLLGM